MNAAFRDAQGIFGENAGLFAGLALVFGIPGAIAEWVTKGGEGAIATVLLPLVASALFAAIAETAITLGALSRVKGQAVGNDMLSAALGFYAPVVIAVMLVSLAAAIGFTLFVLPGIVVLALLFFAIPAIVEEGLGGVRGLARSMALVAGHRTEIFLMVFLFIAVLLGLTLTLEYLLAAAPLLAAFATWAVGGVISAFGTVLAVTGYAQLRHLHGDPIKVEFDPQDLVG